MFKNSSNIWMIIAAIITIIGLVTGKYLFLVLPLGVLFFNKNKGDD